MTANARIEVRFPLDKLIQTGLNAPRDNRRTVDGREVTPLGRAMLWTNDLSDKIEASLAEFECEQTDSGIDFEHRDVGFRVNADRYDEARRRLLDMLAASTDVPAGTEVSLTMYADDSYETVLDDRNDTVGDYRKSLGQ